jgi:uncharacterized protein YjbI with pentapeptide repeats
MLASVVPISLVLTSAGADLSDAYLSGADLSGAYLSGANLSDANLSDADLNSAKLSNLNGLTEEQLKKAKLCKTEMPDGTLNNRDCRTGGLSEE